MRLPGIFFFFLGACLAFAFAKKLPEGFPKCHHIKTEADIPYFEECFKGVVLKWRTYLQKGIPELRIPSLEPLTIPLITVEQNGSVSYVLKLHNTAFHQFTNYTLEEFSYQMKPVISMNGTLAYKNLNLVGHYEIEGNFAGANFKGSGPWFSNLTDVFIHATTEEELYMKKGKRYLNITKIETDTKFGKSVMKMENLFGDNELLKCAHNLMALVMILCAVFGSRVCSKIKNRCVVTHLGNWLFYPESPEIADSIFNEFLRDYSDDILESLKPDLKDILVKVFKQIKKQIISRIPYDDMFLPNS